jgi:hypothetical protein
MASTRAESIATLQQTPATLVQLTSSLGDAALDFRPAPADWSVREILAHLVDDEMYVMRLRLERIVKEDKPHLAPHDEQKWYASRNTTRDALAQLLMDFTVQRAASLGIVGMLRELDWAREGFQPEYGAFTADGQLAMWATHDKTHLRQIEATLQAYAAQQGR